MADSRYQEGIIKRYYQNRDTMALQNLGEIVSELFLCQDPKKAARLWDRAATALKHTGVAPEEIQKILESRDVAALGRLVNALSAGGSPAGTGPAPGKTLGNTPGTTPESSPGHPGAGSPAAPTPPVATRPPAVGAGSPLEGATEGPPEGPMDPLDPQVQKRAMKAFRKRLKLTRLDEESKLGRNPLTTGKPSGIVAITPPNQFPPAVWEELVKQGQLKRSGAGFYALAQ